MIVRFDSIKYHFWVIRIIDFNMATELNFLTPFPAKKAALSYIVLRLTYILVRFSNWVDIFRMLFHVYFLHILPAALGICMLQV